MVWSYFVVCAIASWMSLNFTFTFTECLHDSVMSFIRRQVIVGIILCLQKLSSEHVLLIFCGLQTVGWFKCCMSKSGWVNYPFLHTWGQRAKAVWGRYRLWIDSKGKGQLSQWVLELCHLQLHPPAWLLAYWFCFYLLLSHSSDLIARLLFC